MISNLIKVFLTFLLLLLTTLISNKVQAMTAEEYCKIHTESGAPGTCTPCGSCAVITSNLGTHECKLCSEGGCELSDCPDCPDYPACVE